MHRNLHKVAPPRVQSIKNTPMLQLKQWERNNDPTTRRCYHLRSYQSPNYRSIATRQLLAQHIFSSYTANHIYDASGKRFSVDALLASKNGPTKWNPALSNECGRLAQGNDGGVEATDTIDFIPYSQIPKNKRVTYCSFACDERPLKTERWRIRIVVGGDKLTYDYNVMVLLQRIC